MNPLTSPLLTDLYQLNMIQAYLDHGEIKTAVFEFFVRKLPPRRGFLIAAGLEQALDFLGSLRFSPEEIDWLARTRRFDKGLLDQLATFRFTGDVHAMPEGRAFFANEPILRITAPMPQAQLVETRLINIVHFQSLIAAKAARVVLSAPGKLLVDFGLRRAHGAEAGLLSARASYLAGFTGTATVEAAREFGIPLFGTMAHSYVQAHADEAQAFENFALGQPKNVMLLIDTYDTENAARKVVALAPSLAARGITIKGVRIDSGDLGEHARRVRAILDGGGLSGVTIFASGNLDEYRLAELNAQAAPIDGFGVGTRMNTSADAPYLDCAYKLQEYEGIARRKRSEGKATWPGRKQVYRRHDSAGRPVADLLTLDGGGGAERPLSGRPLIEPVLRAGRPVAPRVALEDSRTRARAELEALPKRLRALEHAAPYPVEVAPELRDLAAEVDRRA
jgi:nicotinate phosphoribosyltransferase